jgi:tetratricopeptide (TPR) repeat protein
VAPPVETLVAAAQALMRAGQWDIGSQLLTSVDGDDPRIALALAELAVDRDYWCGTSGAGELLSKAAAGAAAHAWELALLTTVAAYHGTIIGPDGQARIGPGQHSPTVAAELAARARGVYDTAPPGPGRGWAAFWRGVIADNVAGDRDAARPCYAEALTSGEEHEDDALAAEALRHLGGDARRRGDHDEARRLWERSTALKQRAGLVPSVLSQQLALATNALDTGDPGRATALATEVRRWAEMLGLHRLATQARRLAAAGDSAEPTR